MLTPSGASSPRIEPSASNSEDDRGESPGQHPTTDEKGRRPGCDPAAGPNRIQRDPSKARPPPVEQPAGAEEKEGKRALGIKIEKETNIKGQRTASPGL